VNQHKLELIDLAFSREPKPKSFVDLGGNWNVDGAYTFYAFGKYHSECAYIVDSSFSEKFYQIKNGQKNLYDICGNFATPKIAGQIGNADVAFMFDVLLHQAKPDWKSVIKLYAKQVKTFLIYNPMWIKSESSIRLLGLGMDEYFRNVPHDQKHPSYQDIERNPDSTAIWQYGITDKDLTGLMQDLGFKLEYYKNHGQFGNLKNFENHAFIFSA